MAHSGEGECRLRSHRPRLTPRSGMTAAGLVPSASSSCRSLLTQDEAAQEFRGQTSDTTFNLALN